MKSFDHLITWLPGGAQGNTPEMYDGDNLLVAVRVCSSDKSREWWEFAVVHVTESGFEVEDSSWGWDWCDVEWYAPVKSFDLPVPLVKATAEARKGGGA